MSGFKHLITTEQGVQWAMKQEANGDTTLKASQDLTALLDRNKSLQADGFTGNTGKDDGGLGKHVATVPPIVWEMWHNMYGIDQNNPDHADGVWKLLNDPDWRQLRTWCGRI